MRGSLDKIADIFVQRDGLQGYTFVFPNQRAGLFFRKYLSQKIASPIFSPKFMSINQCFAELSDLRLADSLTLLLRLYAEYQRLRPDNEGLERFIYWGRMMLTDFSEIDNHMVEHVEALFANVRDWHAIDEHFAFLSEDQRLALARFWKEFEDSDIRHKTNDESSKMHREFLHTWELLWPLYKALRESLKQDGLAYEGMLHREVLEHWHEIPQHRLREKYVFIGFNALTGSERQLINQLQAMGRAELYFDYDSPFLCDEENKASLFMSSNIADSSSNKLHKESLSAMQDKPYTLVEVASTVGEAHEVHRILTQIAAEGQQDWTRTVVVLPDEQLLIPLLNTIPKEIKKINVTMGYPLRATSLYMAVANPEKVPLTLPDTAASYLQLMREHLLHERTEENSEGVYQLIRVLDRLDTALKQYPDIHFSVADMQQLLNMLTQEATIPYVGEPLDGLQIMGVLETRALDFDNVIITGFNDDQYLGRSLGNSFIPYVLRCGFGMPTPDRQNAVFAYNFYRMISYAKRVWFISNSMADENHSGEVSRYYYQLKWQYGLHIAHEQVQYNLTAPDSSGPNTIAKDERLDEIPSLSATALNTYLRCPKLFHYRYVERLQDPEPDESICVSDMTIGKVLHQIMENLYKPFLGKIILATDIDSMLQKVDDDASWSALDGLEKLQGDMLAQYAVRSYVKNVLNKDRASAPFQYRLSEKRLSCRYKGTLLHGYIDRMDVKGAECRVVDYKTGSTDTQYKKMSEVFGVQEPSTELAEGDASTYPLRGVGKSQILQTLLYCWLVGEKCPDVAQANIVPHLYPVRRLMPDTDTAVVQPDTAPLVFTEEIKQEFLTELEALLQEIYDKNIPFCPTQDRRTCENCSFVELCKA